MRIVQVAPLFDIIHFHLDYVHFPAVRALPAPTVTTMHGMLDAHDHVARRATRPRKIAGREPFGLVMIEALACGTPVVAWCRGAVPEVIDHGKTGFIVDSPDEAVEAVERIDEIDRRACRDAFEARFDAARMAREYVRVYERLAVTGRSAPQFADSRRSGQ